MAHNDFRRWIAMLLCAVLVLTAMPLSALALPEPSVSFTYTCDTPTPGVGSTLTFSITGTNTADVCMMVVDPSSQMTFLYPPQLDYIILQPGLYIFIAYGTNTTDTTHPDFKRCMSSQQRLLVEGQAQPLLQPGVTEILSQQNGQWASLDNEEIRSYSLPLCIVGTDVPKEAHLKTVLRALGDEITLYDGPAEEVAVADADPDSGKISCYVTGDEAMNTLFSNGYYWDTAVVEACFTLPNGQTLAKEVSFQFCNYTNPMYYMHQFLGPNGAVFQGEKGEALATWLDMSPRDEFTRNNSGYLLMEQQYLDLDSRDWAYYIGEGGLYALETIGSVGANAVVDILTESEIKENFPKSGSKGQTYYNTLSNLYLNYMNTLYQEMAKADEGMELAGKIFEGTVDVFTLPQDIEKVTQAREVSVVMNQNRDYILISNMWNNSTDVSNYSVLSPAVMLVHSDERKAFRLLEGEKIMSHLEQGNHVLLDLTNAPGYDKDSVINDLYEMMQGTEGYYSVPFKESNIETISMAMDFMEETPEFNKLTASQKEVLLATREKVRKTATEKGTFINKKLGKVMDVVDTVGAVADTAFSWYQYWAELESSNAYQEIYFSTLTNVTNEYVTMLDEWRSLILSDGEKGVAGKQRIIAADPDTDWELGFQMEAMAEALAVVKKDILATGDETGKAAAQRIKENEDAFTRESLLSACVSTVQLVCKIPGVKKLVEQAGKAILTQIGKITGKGTAAVTSAFAKFNLATGIASIAHLILDNTAGNVFSHYETLRQLVALQYTLTGNFCNLFRQYAQNPTHEGALTCIAALQMIKSIKQQGESVAEMYYLKDVYKDLDIQESYELQALLLNEFCINADQLHAAENVHDVYEVTMFVEGQIKHQWKFKASGETRDIVYNGEKLEPLPSYFRDLINTTVISYFYRNQTIRTSSSHSFGTTSNVSATNASDNSSSLPPKGTLTAPNYSSWSNPRGISIVQNRLFESDKQIIQSEYGPKGSKGNLGDMVYSLNNIVYGSRCTVFYVDGDMLLELSDSEWEDYLKAEKKINEMLAIDEDSLHWYDFSEKDDLKNLDRIEWVRLTRKYIESLPMYDPNISYH